MLQILKSHLNYISIMVFLLNNKQLAFSSLNNIMWVWDVAMRAMLLDLSSVRVGSGWGPC